jgi:hypothetical protein
VLKPIFAFDDTYVVTTTPEVPLTDPILASEFKSVKERITPTCKYTRFFGPTTDSNKAIVLLNGEEAINAALPDYIYRIEYKITNGCASLWRIIDAVPSAAARVLSVEGKLVQNITGNGCVNVYGFYFPFVVEIPRGGSIVLSIKAIEHFDSTTNPIFAGNHCLARRGRCPQLAYSVQVDKLTGESRRIVASRFQCCNDRLRRCYTADLSLPCVGITPRLYQYSSTFVNVHRIPMANNYNSTLVGYRLNPCDMTINIPFVSTNIADMVMHNTKTDADDIVVNTQFAPVLAAGESRHYTFQSDELLFEFPDAAATSCPGEAILMLRNASTKQILGDSIATEKRGIYYIFTLPSVTYRLQSTDTVEFIVTNMVSIVDNQPQELISASGGITISSS